MIENHICARDFDSIGMTNIEVYAINPLERTWINYETDGLKRLKV